MSFAPVYAPNPVRSTRLNLPRWSHNIRAKHTREGREPYPYYWSTHFRSHDHVPYPTLIPSDHPTAPLHNLFARWQCVLHSYGQKPPKENARSSGQVHSQDNVEKEQEVLFLEIAKQRKIALKLYRLLSMAEAKCYMQALDHSQARVYKRPNSAPNSAISEQLLQILNSKEYRRHWQMLPISLTATEPEATNNTEEGGDMSSATSMDFKLVRQYRFDKMQAASQFVRLACQTIVTHDHHPEIMLHFLPDDRMFEVKISTWTHAPRRLLDTEVEDGRDVDEVLADLEDSDSDFDRVTQFPVGSPTILSPARPKFPKTVNAFPGLTRKDFLLAWDLDGLEIQTRSRTLSLTQKRKLDFNDARSPQNETNAHKGMQASQVDQNSA